MDMLDPMWTPERGYSHATAILSRLAALDAAREALRKRPTPETRLLADLRMPRSVLEAISRPVVLP